MSRGQAARRRMTISICICTSHVDRDNGASQHPSLNYNIHHDSRGNRHDDTHHDGNRHDDTHRDGLCDARHDDHGGVRRDAHPVPHLFR